MCINNSVGAHGVNTKEDTKIIQILLNFSQADLIPLRHLKIDGRFGENTQVAIRTFQSRVLNMRVPDGRVDPNGKTLSALKKNIPHSFCKEILQGIMIHSWQGNIKKYFSALEVKMRTNDIATPLRMAHFLAQLGHESGELRYSEEISSGAQYENRKDLGNTMPGDGKKFKGRGLIQLTGRDNYTKYGLAVNRDFISDLNYKKIANSPALAVDVACWFWISKKLNSLADNDNINAITKRINGGYNGLKDRKEILKRAKFFLIGHKNEFD